MTDTHHPEQSGDGGRSTFDRAVLRPAAIFCALILLGYVIAVPFLARIAP